MKAITRAVRLAWGASPVAALGMVAVLFLWSIAPIFELSNLQALTNVLVSRGSIHPGNPSTLLLTYLLWGMLLPNACWILYYFLFDCVRKVAQRNLAYDVLAKASTLTQRTLEDPSTQDLIARATKVDTGEIFGLFNSSIFLLSAVVRVLSIVGILISFNPWLCVIVSVVAIPGIVIRNTLSKKAYGLVKTQTERERWCTAMLDLLLGRKYAAELTQVQIRSLLRARWQATRRQLDNETDREEQHQTQLLMLSIAIRMTGLFAALFVAITLLAQGRVSVGTLASCIIALEHLQWVISAGIHQASGFFSHRLVFRDIEQLLAMQGERPAAQTQRAPEVIQHTSAAPRVDVRDVTYFYPHATAPALEQIQFTIEPGEHVVLVGKNGSGKTTLLRLLLGLDTPSSGNLLLGGEVMDGTAPDFAREQCTVMFQDFVRYELSLRTNVTISDVVFRENSERIHLALQQADLDALLHQLPDGLETMLGTDLHTGLDVSGGQWQRLAFARARFRERALILLDEPTAALDALQEAQLYQQFMAMARGHTTLIVSHRLPIARLADRIIVLDQGKVVEQGSHDQLMLIEDGYYRKMFQSQSNMYYR